MSQRTAFKKNEKFRSYILFKGKQLLNIKTIGQRSVYSKLYTCTHVQENKQQ